MKIYFSVRDVSKEDMKNLELSQNDAWIRDKWRTENQDNPLHVENES